MPSSVPAAWGNEDNVARLVLSDPDGPCPCEAFYSGKGQGTAHPGLCALSSRTPPAAAGAILSYQMVAGTPGTQLPHCSPGCTLCPVAPSCLAHLADTICNKRGKGKKKKNLIRVPFVGWNPHQSHLPSASPTLPVTHQPRNNPASRRRIRADQLHARHIHPTVGPRGGRAKMGRATTHLRPMRRPRGGSDGETASQDPKARLPECILSDQIRSSQSSQPWVQLQPWPPVPCRNLSGLVAGLAPVEIHGISP